MRKLIFVTLLLAVPQGVSAGRQGQGGRTLAGIIHFTNNTPRDLGTFPVELYTRDRKRRLAATTPDAGGNFRLTRVEAGRYLLKLTWPPGRCTLWYRVDVRKESKDRIQVIMDAACARDNGAVRDLPES
jgi:hypothetical protein